MSSLLPTLWNKRLTCLAGTHLGLAVAVCLLGTIYLQATPVSQETEPTPLQIAPQKTEETRVYYDFESCVNCHSKGFENPDKQICRGAEVPIWQKDDKH